ncbi:hypothetical protein BJX61DRAFT_546470 [Aspergillus egyptiacus]|nr:hypothetical protein BJX61DRAFT_546470 [Aspergillus egyptiacus]
MDPPTSTPEQLSLSSLSLSSLPSSAKTALIATIAQEMTTTIITVSREIQRGTLTPQHTAPLHNFLRTIQRHEVAAQQKLERRLARYQRRARRCREERRRIRREVAEMVRRMEILHRCWKRRVEEMEIEMDVNKKK